ncbi:unnamed protein product [Rhodiola kirilowii]
MGNAIGSAATSVGSALGNVIAAPFKSIFKGSCEGICSSTWDLICFIEHLCVNDLARLLMVLCLCYITLLLIYVLFKIGIFQCITKSLCKMCWAAFKGYWCALFHVARFLCYKIKNTKRVSRKHRNIHHVSDLEKGHKSSSSSDSDYAHTYRHQTINRKRKSFQRELNVRQKRRNSHRHIRLRKADVSFRGKDRARRRSMGRRTKRLQVRNLEIGRTKETSIKRRRL